MWWCLRHVVLMGWEGLAVHFVVLNLDLWRKHGRKNFLWKRLAKWVKSSMTGRLCSTHPSAYSSVSAPLACASSSVCPPSSSWAVARRCAACSRVRRHCTRARPGCCGATKLSSSCYNCYSSVRSFGCPPPEKRRTKQRPRRMKASTLDINLYILNQLIREW